MKSVKIPVGGNDAEEESGVKDDEKEKKNVNFSQGKPLYIDVSPTSGPQVVYEKVPQTKRKRWTKGGRDATYKDKASYPRRYTKIEHAAIMIGIFGIIFSSFATLDNLSLMKYGVPYIRSATEDYVQEVTYDRDDLAAMSWPDVFDYMFAQRVPGILIITSSMTVLFSTLLVAGIGERKPKYLRIYYWYACFATLIPILYSLLTSDVMVSQYGFRYIPPRYGISFYLFYVIFILGSGLANIIQKRYEDLDLINGYLLKEGEANI